MKRKYRTKAEKLKIVKNVEALVKKGSQTAVACRSHGVWPIQYTSWKKGKGLGPAGQGSWKGTQPRQPTKRRRKPPEPVTIEIPDTAPMCVLYGPTDKILEALQLLRG